jgi:hypothetical protein
MKKLAFSLSVLAASLSAQAELTELADFDLTNVTGQAGVDIGLDVGIDIGEIRYTDTEENGDGDGGSVSINNIHLGGANKSSFFGYNLVPNASDRIDEFTLKIDVLADGDLRIAGSPDNGNAIDFYLGTGEIKTLTSTGQSAATLINSIDMTGIALGLLVRVDGTTGDIIMSADFAIEDMDIDASAIGLKFNDVYVTGSEYNEQIEQFGTANLIKIGATFGATLSADSTGMTIAINPNTLDMGIGSLDVGGTSIGSVIIDDLAFNGVTLHVSGH